MSKVEDLREGIRVVPGIGNEGMEKLGVAAEYTEGIVTDLKRVEQLLGKAGMLLLRCHNNCTSQAAAAQEAKEPFNQAGAKALALGQGSNRTYPNDISGAYSNAAREAEDYATKAGHLAKDFNNVAASVAGIMSGMVQELLSRSVTKGPDSADIIAAGMSNNQAGDTCEEWAASL